MKSLSRKISSCRVCRGKKLRSVLSLGATPPANAFLAKNDLQKPEPFFPLELKRCSACGFIQLAHAVSPELLFRNYVYVSSTSKVFVAHFEELAKTVAQKLKINAGSLAIDIGSNDGVLLKPLKALGCLVLGIDPATKIAAEATKNGIRTIPEFFTPALAKKIRAEHGTAKLVTATSAFPHIHDLDSILKGVKILLAKDGVFLIEAYYLGSLIEKNLFDTVYHEHLSYFTLKTISRLMKRLGMKVFDVDFNDTHGGSMRVFAQLKGGAHAPNLAALKAFAKQEKNRQLDKSKTFVSFAGRIAENKHALGELLRSLKNQGKLIAGYGAPAKGNTLLNYFGIGPETIEYIVDDSPWKQGLFTPGTHIPVVTSAMLSQKKPDYVLILAWNFAAPIMQKLTDYRAAGGKFIIPVPKPSVIS